MESDLQSFLFIGLGNPGARYEFTRHNIGYLVVQELAHRLGWSLKEDRRFNAKVAKGVVNDKNIHLMLPLTYMNLSGEAVRRYVDYFKLPLNCLLVITDDIAFDFNQLRLKEKGSSGGHNGLKSIHAYLGISDYKRLRMGIGHPGDKQLADYVLETFSLEEQQQLPSFIDQAVKALQQMLTQSFSTVMTSVNTVSQQTKIKVVEEVKPIDLTKPPYIGRGE